MILYPAIDLKGGAVVRLLQGDMDKATAYNADPADQARRFVAAGCQWLHIVDLDGAFAGQPENREAVQAILAAVEVPVQLGGGVRSLETIEGWLVDGVQRIILGTAAVRDPNLVIEACRAFPDRIAVGIDARGGHVAVSGWAETSEMTAETLARRFEHVGVAAIVYTDIERDGTLSGVNIAATRALAEAVAMPVIASGGVRDLSDIAAARDAGSIAGVVAGRALYDGSLDLAEALSAASATGAPGPAC